MKNLKLGILSIFLVFMGISNVYADRVCTYQNGTDYTVTCTTDDDKKTVDCVIDANPNYKIKSDLVQEVSYSDFKNECARSIKVMASTVRSKFEVEKIVRNTTICGSGELHFCKEVAKTSEEVKRGNGFSGSGDSGSFGNTGETGNTGSSKEFGGNRGEGFSSSEYLKDPDYIAAYNDANKYCDSTDPIYNDSLKCEEARQKMNEIKAKYTASGTSEALDLEHFCQGRVQGVFTTLGWVFFILKIVIPIIIIIFGSIDFAKAVIASKDDEIKKSAVSLAKRAVVGILIFFIPTIINFVVNIIDDKNVYNGTFKDCTKCMLDPNHKFEDGSTCKNLRGN